MTANTLAMVAAAFSLVMTLLLALSDPKRRWLMRRESGSREDVYQPVAEFPRRALACLMFAPGVALMAAGLWSGFILWLAAVLVGGWVVAQVLSWRSGESQ